MDEMTDSVERVVTRGTAVRIAKDVRDVMNDETVRALNIYYQHDMDNFMCGRAMIVGPADTPYEHGFFFFLFKFPESYPYDPPKVVFRNRSDRIRYNPNLYESGKVCLSILNTWEGEPWSACQSIRSILITLCSMVFTDNPITNEPGIPVDHRDADPYRKSLRYVSLYSAFAETINSVFKGTTKSYMNPFVNDIIEYADSNLTQVIERAAPEKNEVYTTRIYNMIVNCDYDKLRDLLRTAPKLMKLYKTKLKG